MIITGKELVELLKANIKNLESMKNMYQQNVDNEKYAYIDGMIDGYKSLIESIQHYERIN
jgi:hypothetical protein